MNKSTKLAKARTKNLTGAWPFIVWVGIFGFGLIGYIMSQILTMAEAHPSHLTVAAVSAVFGGFFGWLWYHYRGDII